MGTAYATLSEIVAGSSITTIFRCKGNTWSSGWHNGVDIAAAQGTPIKAADGTVVNADTVEHTDGFGNRVILKHPDGRASLYAHMVSPAPVKVGQAVKKGDVIGYIGSTGKSTGAHLHLTILDNYDRNPNIYYKGDLLDPISVCGLGTLKFSAGIGSTIVEGGVAKNLGDLNKYYGSTAAEPAPVPSASTTNGFKVGDVVNFVGTTRPARERAVSRQSPARRRSRLSRTVRALISPHK